MAETKKKEVRKIPPITSIQSDEAGVARFVCTLPRGTLAEDIENPALYTNVASRIPVQSEIRVNAEDESFVAWLYVSFAHGNNMAVHTIKLIELEEIQDADVNSRYIAKLRGPKKWCVQDTVDGSWIMENLPTQIKALQEIADLEKAFKK